jgi:hypothetical protein
MNTPNPCLVNPEALQSRQLLLQRSSDEDNCDDDEEEEVEDEETEITEEQKNDEVEVIGDDHSEDTPIIEPSNEHLYHSISAPVFPFPIICGRGSSSQSMVL